MVVLNVITEVHACLVGKSNNTYVNRGAYMRANGLRFSAKTAHPVKMGCAYCVSLYFNHNLP
jgi:hypothetical protein